MKIIPDDLFEELIQYFEDKGELDGKHTGGFNPNKEMQFSSRLNLCKTFIKNNIVNGKMQQQMYSLIKRKLIAEMKANSDFTEFILMKGSGKTTVLNELDKWLNDQEQVIKEIK